MTTIYLCGLYQVNSDDIIIPSAPMPLQGVHVDARVVDMVTEVSIIQTYYNNQSVPIQASYVFPLDESAAVCEFEAEVDGKLVAGVVKEKEEAKRDFQAAVARGDGAYLLEQHKADIFSIKVGNLPPFKHVAVKLSYITTLKVEENNVRFLLPTAVAPRYTPASDSNPPPPNGGVVTTVGRSYWGRHSLPYGGLSLSLGCDMKSAITKITSPTHGIAITQDSTKPLSATVALASGLTTLDRDLVVLIETATPHEPRLCVETDNANGGSRALMLTLVPHFELDDVKCEIIFVVDRSGSMAGTQMNQARDALSLFLKSLPVDSLFNIVGFGSSHQVLFPGKSVEYSERTLKTATDHVRYLEANLGGTELLAPLEAIARMPLRKGYPRQVFVLTDGQVSNTEAVIAQVQRDSAHARYFALGIGSGVSHHLVEGIGRAGKGNAQFVIEGERMETKVIRQLKDAIQPSLTEVSVDWGVDEAALAAEAPKVKSLLGYKKPEVTERAVCQAPYHVPPVFDGSRFLIFAFLKAGVALPKKVTVKAISPDGPLEVDMEVKEDEVFEGSIVHKMAARTLIRDLEEGTSYMHQTNSAKGFKRASDAAIRAEIIRLGTTYTLASRHTSFIAVEERDHTRWVGESTVFHRPPPAPAAPVVVAAPTFSAYSAYSAYPSPPGGAPMMYRSASPVASSPRASASLSSTINSSLHSAMPSRPLSQQQQQQQQQQQKESKSKSSSYSFFGAFGGSSAPAPPPPAPVAAAAAPPSRAAPSASYDMRASNSAPMSSMMRKKSAPVPRFTDARSDEGSYNYGSLAKTASYEYEDDEEEASEDLFGSGDFLDMSSAPPPPPSESLQPQLHQQLQQAPSKYNASTLRAIVDAQKLDGSFGADSTLLSAVGVSLKDVEALATKLKVSVVMVATALAVACLQNKLSDFSEDWQLIVNKSFSWLKKNLKSSGASIDHTTLVQEAGTLLK